MTAPSNDVLSQPIQFVFRSCATSLYWARVWHSVVIGPVQRSVAACQQVAKACRRGRPQAGPGTSPRNRTAVHVTLHKLRAVPVGSSESCPRQHWQRRSMQR